METKLARVCVGGTWCDKGLQKAGNKQTARVAGQISRKTYTLSVTTRETPQHGNNSSKQEQGRSPRRSMSSAQRH